MCISLCVENFGDWLQNPSELDVKTRLGRPGGQWHEKKGLQSAKLRLDAIQRERLRRNMSIRVSRRKVSVGKGWRCVMLELVHSRI